MAVDSPGILVIVTPRERFAHAEQALERLLAGTQQAHDLLYLDGFGPGLRRRRLRRLQRQHGFRVLRIRRTATPNQARNLALEERGAYDYLAFLDNDIDVEPGWLRALVACAEETGAEVCGPLCLEHRDGRREIHVVGGDARIDEADGARRYSEINDLAGSPVGEAPAERRETGLAEFHCMLVRREVFDRLGPLDEGLRSLLENGDFCMRVRAAGGRIWLEPKSVVTYVTPPRLGPTDLLYFWRRWSAARGEASADHFRRTWAVEASSPGLQSAEGFSRWHRRLPLRLLRRRLRGVLRRGAGDE